MRCRIYAKRKEGTNCTSNVLEPNMISMQRRALVNDITFRLTTKIREAHYLVTSFWTYSPLERLTNTTIGAISAQRRLLHSLQLTSSVNNLVEDLLQLRMDDSVDTFTCLVVVTLYVLRGMEETTKAIHKGGYVEFEDFPGLRKIPISCLPHSAWNHLKGTLKVSTAFFALPQPLESHFELLDPREFKAQVESLVLSGQFTAEAAERHSHYKAVQTILLENVTAECALNQLLILLDDLCRFQHLSLKSAMVILAVFLTSGSEAASKMISLGVIVDCSEMSNDEERPKSKLWFSLHSDPRIEALCHTLRFLRVEERFTLRQLCTEIRKLIYSPAFEVLALQEILWLTSGHLNAEIKQLWRYRGMRLARKISSWHLLGAMMVGCLRRSFGKFNDLIDLQNWFLRLKGLLSTGQWQLAVCDTQGRDHFPSLMGVTPQYVAERIQKSFMEFRPRSDAPLFAIKALLCDTQWREAVLNTQNPVITPGTVLRWASGLLRQGRSPVGLASPSEMLSKYPHVAKLDDEQLWLSDAKFDSRSGDSGKITPLELHCQILPKLGERLGLSIELVRERPCLCFRIFALNSREWHDFTVEPEWPRSWD
eukprot:Gregarina_sp_Poly_1__750@NODE_117_length_13667_cov_177_395147_g104_i0_p1_GENE_NODE_117_length_13667_cov_177_395147_g104_i0NODE_117_length_13667_cov_177_395147_g104_i0_p1_ORF_typecomplete_len595_score69_83CCDC92/PF14916_6/0_33_NODE_117_length_13667_cov_177_395147_g104_i019023686